MLAYETDNIAKCPKCPFRGGAMEGGAEGGEENGAARIDCCMIGKLELFKRGE